MLPRQIIPGRTYLITRRVARRELRLKPSPVVNQLLLYCLAHAARKTGIEIHAFAFLSNHHHLIITDPDGRLPLFCQNFHGLVARALNCHQGRWEYLWAPGSYSAVHLESAEDLLDKLEYLYVNPVSAGLVRRSTDWPGLISTPGDLASKLKVGTRPSFFFSERTGCPRKIKMKLVYPRILEGREENVIEALERRITIRETLIGDRMINEGRQFLGPDGVRAQSPFEFPKTSEPRRQLSPHLAARDVWRRIEALGQLVSFRQAYSSCRERFFNGDRDVEFPLGSYGPRVLYGAKVQELAPG